MKKISDRFRKILRKVFYGLGVSVISLILQACYGPMLESTVAYGMPNPRINFSGTVKAKKTNMPIKGIQVSLEDIDGYILTDKDGYFYFTLWSPTLEEYNLIIKDIDGKDNDGLFKKTTRKLNLNDSDKPLLIDMDEDTGSDEE
jgi:putative lipoprotein (rSAM/lipoprotein system)